MGFLTTLERRDDDTVIPFASLENPNIPLGNVTLLELLGAGRIAATGRRVNEQSALGYSPVFAAINIISGSIGSLPAKLFRRLDNGGKEEERGHPAWDLVHNAPNDRMSSGSFREALQGHLLAFGNGYAEIVRNGAGRPEALWPFNPNEVNPKLINGRVVYEITMDPIPVRIPADRVLHVPGLGFDGWRGYAVIQLARESLALGLAAEEFGARFYGNNSRPSGILSSEVPLKDEARKRLKKSWEEAQGGLTNAHRVAVLEGGITWQQIGLSAEDSQFIEQRQFQVEETARWFNIPPHKIGHLERSTFSNIEEQNIEYVTDTLLPWIVRWEQTLNRMLLTPRERTAGLFFKLETNQLLRGDTEKRGSFYANQFAAGALTPNEIRAMEGLNPIEGGDRAFVQVNTIPLDQADQLGALSNEPRTETRTSSIAQTIEYRSPDLRVRLMRNALPTFKSAARSLVLREVRDLRSAAKILPDVGMFLGAIDRLYRDELPEVARRIMSPIIMAHADTIAGVAADEVNADVPAANVQLFAREYARTFVKAHMASGRRQIQKIAKKANDNGDDVRAVVLQRLDEWEGAGDSRSRDERVAEHETRTLSNATSRIVWALAGVTFLVSRSVGDSCPYCIALDGRRVGISEAFLPGGVPFQPEGADTPLTPRHTLRYPPYHSGCNCIITPG